MLWRNVSNIKAPPLQIMDAWVSFNSDFLQVITIINIKAGQRPVSTERELQWWCHSSRRDIHHSARIISVQLTQSTKQDMHLQYNRLSVSFILIPSICDQYNKI